MPDETTLTKRKRLSGHVANYLHRFSPDIKGKSRTIGLLDSRLGGYARNETDRYALIDGKYWMRLDLRGSMDKILYHRSNHEYEAVKRFTELLEESKVVFDIGTHVGYYTMMDAHKLGSSGSVHSFEADPTIFEYLKSNVEVNGFDNVTLNNMAVVPESGTVSFYSAEGFHGGTGSLIQSSLSAQEPITTEAVSIDDYVKEKQLDHLDLMKIDVEGAELDVLAGAVKTLGTLRPRIICEVGPPDISIEGAVAEAMNRLEKFTAENDYLIETIADYHGLPYVLLSHKP